MKAWKHFLLLLYKDWLLELRQTYAISGILLYVFSTVFIVYVAFIKVQPSIWNVLFWIILLFAAVNAIVKSFVQENGQRQLYYYLLADPTTVILAKMTYNALLLLILSLLSWAILGFIAGNPVRQAGDFLLALLLGSIGFSITFTFVAAIAGKADNNSTLLAILSFPLVIPILMTLVKLSANAIGLLADTSVGQDITILIGIDTALLGLSILLYPFLWRD